MKLHHLLASTPDQDPILAGRLDGKRMFARAIEEVPPQKVSFVVVMDFGNVDLATSSFMSEAVLPLREHLRARRPPVFLVVANLNEKVREELEELLSRLGEALLACEYTPGMEPKRIELLGTLKPELLETWDLVRSKGETTAVELHSGTESDGIGPTAWNNRLAALASKSLVVEVPQGRSKKYRSILESA